jgi:uroporphyrinogen III methyltransferase/synthase
MAPTADNTTPLPGTVYLVGAGPGALGLFTIRGMEIVSTADVILYDKLLCNEILNLRKPDAEIIFVGKTRSKHCVIQDEINKLLVLHARRGKTVCRLKGGDPFVFGRGGEEASFLRQNNIPFEVVPGVTSSIAVPAYAGIPVTDRRCASAFSVITGHTRSDLGALDWPHLANTTDTRVFLMGLSNIDEITRRLIENGAKPTTPTAVIAQGCSAAQRVITGTLADIADQVRAADLPSPAIIVVGDVVTLRNELQWFETRPLFGKRILITRPQHQSGEIAARLRELGADTIQMPLIRQTRITPNADLIEELAAADWLLFTSANALPFLLDQLRELGSDIRALGKAKIGAIGQTSAALLEQHGLHVALIPSAFTGETFGIEMPEPKGKRIVIVRAKQGREELAEVLRKRGADVRIVASYETVTVDEATIPQGPIDLVVLTSPTTAQSFSRIYAGKTMPPAATVGPITANAARALGITVVAEAEEHSMAGLARAISHHFSNAPTGQGEQP